jgi:hypothetical protein
MRVLGQDMIILNSEQVASDLLEQRSEKYSDRPVFSALDLCVFAFCPASYVMRDLSRATG